MRAEQDTLTLRVDLRPGTASLFYSDRSPVTFTFRGGAYAHRMAGESALVMFDPGSTVSCTIAIPPEERLIAVHMSVDVLHRLLNPELSGLPFLGGDRAGRRFHVERPQTVDEQRTLYQLDTQSRTPGLERMLVLARALELFYHRFSADADDIHVSCPFLADEENVERIRTARNILTEELRDPPNIRDLARRIGMNETHLKTGFKRIYGSPIYSWVVGQRMGRALAMLESGRYNVNEVAEAVGYANVSQFIAAFRKRHGITPGKVAQRVRESFRL
jgi:AraC-like DNA-binding protein